MKFLPGWGLEKSGDEQKLHGPCLKFHRYDRLAKKRREKLKKDPSRRLDPYGVAHSERLEKEEAESAAKAEKDKLIKALICK